jgi:pimeloyl-ACP methyl ester carboxylesterase
MVVTSAINRRVPTRVGTLAMADHGEGIPVVMWPSLFSDHRFFALVVEELGDGWRTIRVDGPGFGESDAPKGTEQASDYADALMDLLDGLGLESAYFAGCSWGGQVSAQAGARHPGRARGILLMNTPLGPSLGGHAFQVIGTRLIGSTAFWGKGVAKSMFAPASASLHPERVQAFVDAITTFDRSAEATTVRTVMTRFPGLADVLPHVPAPFRILMGEDDRLYPPDAMAPFAGLAAHAVIEVVPGCGHLAPLEAPEAVASAIRRLVGAG